MVLPRICLLVAVLGCGGADPAAPPHVAPPAPQTAATQPHTHSNHPITATHGAAIERVAVTEDGRAAVTSDANGGIRLWPRLDGTREPIVVHAAPPRALAIAIDGDGFVFADHDEAAGVELIRLADSGDVRGRATLAPEPAIAQVELTAHGALVRRVDQSLELVDVTGASHGRVVPDPGTRISALVHRTGRVLAVIDQGKTTRARWVEVRDGTLAWGEATPVLPLDPARPIVMSPDHARVAGASRSKQRTPIVVDLATGKAGKRPVCVVPAPDDAQIDPFSLGDRDELRPAALGFIDPSTIACASSSVLAWWKVTGEQIDPARANAGSMSNVDFVAADHQLIGGFGPQLAMYAPAGAKYLGYGFRDPTLVNVAGDGVLIGKGEQQPILLDARLHERARYTLPKQDGGWTDLYPIDDRYVLTAHTMPLPADAWGSSYQLAVYDSVKRAVHQRLPNHAARSAITYEPATHLLATNDGVTNILLRFDPATHSFGERVEIESTALIERIYLLDPARADGLIALGIHDDDGGLIIDELHGDDPRAGKIAARTSYRISGELAAADRAGQVYVHSVMDKDAVAIYRHGSAIAKLPALADQVLYPSADGTLVAAFATPRVTLATTGGVVLWRAVTWGASQVGWTTGGDLIARFPGGLAKLELATGALADRQCGWGFGLADTPFDTDSPAPIVCDVAP